MNYLDTTFQFYDGNIFNPIPLGVCTLQDFINANRSPNEKIKTVFNQIAEASLNGDNALKAKLKTENLFSFTPAVLTNGGSRCYDNIISYNEIAILDFDNLAPEKAVEFKHFLFENLPSCICCYLSPSRKGVKALVRIKKCYSVEDYKSHIYALGYYFEKYAGWDGSVQNPILCLFLSWDENLLFRRDASVFGLRGGKKDEFKKYEGVIEPLENVTQEQTDKVKSIFTRGISNIVDNAYPTMRGLCLALGGFSGFGYISIEEAEDLIRDCISDNDYMSKNTKHYIKNGIEFLHKGALSPLPLKEDE
jgi:hypothetical protein